MKGFREFDDGLLDTSQLLKRTGKTILCNMGKIIALFVFLIMLTVTFTDVSFQGFFTESFTSSLLLLLTSSYIIYFSLEDAGEKHGEESAEFDKASARFSELREKINGSDVDALRDFCIEYSERDLEYRQKILLLSRGLSEKDAERYKNGEHFDKASRCVLKKHAKMKPVILTPKTLLSREKTSGRSELENPEKRKLTMLILKLIPSTVCMMVTVSVILSTKEGLTASDILNGIIKLSALPVIGFKGYSAGYSYVKHNVSLFLETKANILEEFINKRSSSNAENQS